MPLYAFEPRRPEPLRPDPDALAMEQAAMICFESEEDWQRASEAWRAACGAWSKAGDRLRAEWALLQAGRCELELDPTYAAMKASGRVKVVRLGE